ncbi:hypothetical protein NQ317_018932, partial [Molorchus minor]
RNLPEELLLENQFIKICKQLDCTWEDIAIHLERATELYFSTDSNIEWRYICLNFYILHLLNIELDAHDDILSVQQSKDVKNCIKNILTIGICTKLQPNLPLYMKTGKPEPADIFLNYNILKCTTVGLCDLLKCPNMRILILPDSLKAALVAIYQICFCPLKRPAPNDYAMTEKIYNKLLSERQIFLDLLENLRQTIHPGILVKETMVIFQANAPTWFKKSVSKSLTSIMRSKNGVENIATALFDGVLNDSAQTWKILDVFSKLILSCRVLPDFENNICKQLVEMLDKITEECLIFERIFIHCTKSLYQVDQELVRNIFVRKIVTYFLYFTYRDHKFNYCETLTLKITQQIRLAHGVFVENSQDSPRFPLEILKPVINVVFRFYIITTGTKFKSMNKQLEEILIRFLEDILPFRNDVIIKVEHGDINLKSSDHTITYSPLENSECLLKLLKNKSKLMVNFFGYLINCLTNKDKYFEKAKEDLLELESEFMNEYFERNLTVYKLLAELSEDATVQESITKHPDDIITYISNVLEKSLQTNTHTTKEIDSESFHSLFTVVMILQILVTNSAISTLDRYKVLTKPLKIILKEQANHELGDLITNILEVLKRGKDGKKTVVGDLKNELDKVLDEICDPLLPVRGHGLMNLTKLVKNKDTSVVERKQYVLNIFQQNLKNQDSYIYLSAIDGLAAMADIFPDTIINILCEEFSDYSRNNDDGHEVRMKVGESLVRVTKLLGEMAPKYKSLLLNTFLIGAKDKDHLIRASSLSNLGEICRVLGYKLGTIATEVLVCVHAIIATDKAPEARRAAVTVIRQLFIGLDKEMIAFLKDDILPIYRTLKEVYNNDKDDVMRLQAQLALEELNENMRNFVFPKPQLNMEKKIVMLN